MRHNLQAAGACEDLPGYETWAEGKNTGVLIWANGAGNKARIRPSG